MKLPKAHQDNQNWIKDMVMKNSSVMNGGINYKDQDNEEEEENQEQYSQNRGRNMDGKNNYFNLVEKSNNNGNN